MAADLCQDVWDLFSISLYHDHDIFVQSCMPHFFLTTQNLYMQNTVRSLTPTPMEHPTRHDGIRAQLNGLILCLKMFSKPISAKSLRLFLWCCRLRRIPASALASQCTWEPSRNSDLNGKECAVVSSPSLTLKLRQYVLLLLPFLSLTHDRECKRREWNTNRSSPLTFPLSVLLSLHPFLFLAGANVMCCHVQCCACMGEKNPAL